MEADPLPSPRITSRLLRPFLAVEKNLTSYDLFALIVAIMLVGHVFYYFIPHVNWLRVVDRMFVPIFLISIGYNTGYKPGRTIWAGAIILTLSELLLLEGAFYINVLGTIIVIRLILEPVMGWALQSKVRFWGLNAACTVLYPLTSAVFEYGTMGLVMAMAGWINRNRDEVPPMIVKPLEYFVFAYGVYLLCTHVTFQFSHAELVVIAVGLAWTMRQLYEFRHLLINTLRRKPRDIIEKICSFMGHKSLEIYVVHVLVYQIILYYAVHRH